MQNGVVVELFNGSDLHELIEVIISAMCTNPLHIAAFGSADSGAVAKQRRMFNIVLRQPECRLHVAKRDNRIVGVMNYYLPGKCQLPPFRTMMLLPHLAISLGKTLPRILAWKKTWAWHDAKTPHLHFGPLAVAPAAQGTGVGSALLQYFCNLADADKQDAYLETDKKENLKLYERFGFRVVASDNLLGVANWFMLRTYGNS